MQAVTLAQFAHFLDLSNPVIRQQLAHYEPVSFQEDSFRRTEAACVLLQKSWRAWIVRNRMDRRHIAARRLQLVFRAHVAFREMCRPLPLLGLPLVRDAPVKSAKNGDSEGSGIYGAWWFLMLKRAFMLIVHYFAARSSADKAMGAEDNVTSDESDSVRGSIYLRIVSTCVQDSESE